MNQSNHVVGWVIIIVSNQKKKKKTNYLHRFLTWRCGFVILYMEGTEGSVEILTH